MDHPASLILSFVLPKEKNQYVKETSSTENKIKIVKKVVPVVKLTGEGITGTSSSVAGDVWRVGWTNSDGAVPPVSTVLGVNTDCKIEIKLAVNI